MGNDAQCNYFDVLQSVDDAEDDEIYITFNMKKKKKKMREMKANLLFYFLLVVIVLSHHIIHPVHI